MIPIDKYKNTWRQTAPGELSWQHADGRLLQVVGMEDNQAYRTIVSRHNAPNKYVRITDLGKKLAVKPLSPYYISGNGIGERGKSENARIRSLYPTVKGTREDAIAVAYKYMRGK